MTEVARHPAVEWGPSNGRMLSLGPNGTTRKDPMANPNFPAMILIIRHGEKPDDKVIDI